MNKINPEKLMLSKWTAIKPKQKERHFIVTKLVRDENEMIISCELEAVINRHIYQLARIKRLYLLANWLEMR
ncbi:MAG: TIGR02450 family Trp-rich protein [Methylococcaceae bacterium]